MLGQNFVHLLYGYCWEDLTWKDPYKDMTPEEVFRKIESVSATIKDEEGHLYSALQLLYNPDTEQYYIGIEPGYTRESVAFDTWEEIYEYIVGSIEPFVEEDGITLGRRADDLVVYTGG